MDQRTRKLMTMDKVLHPRGDIDRLYVSKKEIRRGIVSTEDSVDASIEGSRTTLKRVKKVN